jgi:hypothetical protein
MHKLVAGEPSSLESASLVVGVISNLYGVPVKLAPLMGLQQRGRGQSPEQFDAPGIDNGIP